MKSLEYLNQTSSQAISFTDARDADVIFDRFPEDRDFTYSSASFYLYNACDIIEIIQPQYTNIRYKINITGNVTLNFGSIPSGVTVTQSGGIYTVYGIDSLGDWNSMKNPLVTIDTDYFGDVSYTATVIYNTETQNNVEVSWNVGAFIPQIGYNVEATLSAVPTKIVDPTIVFNVISDIRTELELIILMTADIFCAPTVNYNVTPPDFNFVSTLTCQAIKYAAFSTRTTLASNTAANSGYAIDLYNNTIAAAEHNDPPQVRFYNSSGTQTDSINSAFGQQDPYAIEYMQFVDGSNVTDYAFYMGGTEGNTAGRIYYKNSPSTSWSPDSLTSISSSTASIAASASYFVTVMYQDNRIATVYDLESPRVLTSSLNFKYNITSPDNISDLGTMCEMTDDYLVIAGRNYSDILIYDPSDGSSIGTWSPGFTIESIDLFQNYIAASSTTSTKVYDIETDTVVETYSQGTGTAAEGSRKMVSMCEEVIAIADPNELLTGSIYGKVYIYQRATGSLHTSIQNPNINTGSGDDKFGSNIKITTDFIVITAYNEDNSGTNTGAIYIYK